MVQVNRGRYEYALLLETIRENTCPCFMRGEQFECQGDQETCPEGHSNGLAQAGRIRMHFRARDGRWFLVLQAPCVPSLLAKPQPLPPTPWWKPSTASYS